MKKMPVLALIAGLVFTGVTAERVVVYEIGTGTWCQFCPGAAGAADRIAEEHPGQVLILENHNGDAFANTASNARNAFYGISGYPTTLIDGNTRHEGGNCYLVYDLTFQERQEIPPPVGITLENSYQEAYLGSGTVTATIVNESGAEVSGKLHFTVTESHIPYSWQGLEWLHWVVREMLPDHEGEEVTIPAGDTLVKERDYTINQSWSYFTEDANCELGCFLQAPSREILNAAVIPLLGPISCEVTNSVIDNEDGKLHLGETSDFFVTLLNTSDWTWDEVTGTLSADDDKVAIIDPQGTWIDVAPDAEASNQEDPFSIKLLEGEDGYRPDLTLALDDGKSEPGEFEFKVFQPPAVTEGESLFRLDIPRVISKNSVITLSAPFSVSTEVVLFDAGGRMVTRVFSGRLSEGTNLLPLVIEDLTEGVYFVKVTFGDCLRVEKLLVIH
ncbi:Omp28-related outer membrane protein [candidate division WOR-3 bacterium]|uniref:Omp28-related outer membrane protein n=1 Tax=candidate division WOR-3 bacterium TaxID=2052148 RepID=A0A9D5K8G3_UNCW3|nr:Omp28-related outer membrane protein [candidate division WOR-3 bacterium]MBD3363619.1 Omp28-related outer membrane protein [candidate division WOR-3 bacterium]